MIIYPYDPPVEYSKLTGENISRDKKSISGLLDRRYGAVFNDKDKLNIAKYIGYVNKIKRSNILTNEDKLALSKNLYNSFKHSVGLSNADLKELEELEKEVGTLSKNTKSYWRVKSPRFLNSLDTSRSVKGIPLVPYMALTAASVFAGPKVYKFVAERLPDPIKTRHFKFIDNIVESANRSLAGSLEIEYDLLMASPYLPKVTRDTLYSAFSLLPSALLPVGINAGYMSYMNTQRHKLYPSFLNKHNAVYDIATDVDRNLMLKA